MTEIYTAIQWFFYQWFTPVFAVLFLGLAIVSFYFAVIAKKKGMDRTKALLAGQFALTLAIAYFFGHYWARDVLTLSSLGVWF